MNLKKKKEEIRRENFPTAGLVVITIMGGIGLLFVFMSGILDIETYSMLYDCISKNGIMIIFGLFFFFISIYCWIGFFRNIVINPKKEVLYLSKNNENEFFLINKKGKKLYYDNYNNKEENHYYYVLKTYDYIYEVLEECNETFDDLIPKEKKSYWLNFYSPIGNFEEILLLPIIYVMLLPGILSFIMSKGYQKIYGLIFSAIPLYVIIYDLIYKIKLKKSNTNIIDETNFLKTYEIIKKIIYIIVIIILCIICITIFFK